MPLERSDCGYLGEQMLLGLLGTTVATSAIRHRVGFTDTGFREYQYQDPEPWY